MEGKVYSLLDKIEVCSISRAFLCILFIRNLSNRQSINFFYQKDLRFKITIPPCFVVSKDDKGSGFLFSISSKNNLFIS